jgi:hypothetical protein
MVLHPIIVAAPGVVLPFTGDCCVGWAQAGNVGTPAGVDLLVAGAVTDRVWRTPTSPGRVRSDR